MGLVYRSCHFDSCLTTFYDFVPFFLIIFSPPVPPSNFLSSPFLHNLKLFILFHLTKTCLFLPKSHYQFRFPLIFFFLDTRDFSFFVKTTPSGPVLGSNVGFAYFRYRHFCYNFSYFFFAFNFFFFLSIIFLSFFLFNSFCQYLPVTSLF